MSASRNRSLTTRLVRRAIIALGVSLLGTLLYSEIAHRFLRDPNERPPGTIELIVPAGTAASIAAGQDVASIPDEMVFVTGDTLLVINEDLVPHQLGPLYIPPGSRASLVLDQSDRYNVACSFRPTQNFGLDVRPAADLSDRIIVLTLVAPVTAVFIFLYGLAVIPLQDRQNPALPR